MCGGSALTDLRTSTAPGETRTAAWNPRAAVVEHQRTSSTALVGRKLFDCRQNIRCLWQYFFFEIRAVRHRAVHRRHALDWRVEVFEQLLADACRDLRAEAACERVFVRDDDLVGLADQFGDAVPVIRHDRAQVEYGDADAVLFRLLRRQERTLHQRTPRQHD